ncbi:MAG: DegV family EDD domain-containing protein [Acidimicrobiales bacterium]|nr:MAG: DegV family EDD domain-containing protein [Acidimicrobiales bacterium]
MRSRPYDPCTFLAVVTDSSAQLTAAEAAAAGVTVVPIVVTIDGSAFLEGIELSPEDFYARVADAGDVALSTSQPSPGAFAEVYQRLAEEGVDEIISIHVTASSSGTLNAARLGAAEVDVPVHLVDSNMTSYGLGVLALEAAANVRTGHSAAEVIEGVQAMIPAMSVVFLLQDPKYTLRGGRLRQTAATEGGEDVLILGGTGGGFDVVGSGSTVLSLVDQMAAFLLRGDHDRHVAVAFAGPDTIDFTEGLEAALTSSPKVTSVHRYRMSASVAVHTGVNTAGGFSWPTGP